MKRKYFIPILSCLILAACTTPKTIIKEVPIEVVKTRYETEYIHDSTYIHDSIYMAIKGDTIYKSVFKTKYVQKIVHDTTITHDTVPIPIKETIVETKMVKKAQWWPVWLALGLVAAYFIITKTKFIAWLADFIKYIINLFKK